MTAEEIVKLLAYRHSEDVFVPECKDGPSFGGMRRLDAWVMRRSWSNPTTFGYEVKVSRGDFLQDTKWRDYLAVCSRFYFVCPWGLIQPSELPSEAGLLWVAKTESRLWEKKKAPDREPHGPSLETLMRYVLMARTKVTRENGDDPAGYWREWLKKDKDDRDLGHMVKGEIRNVANRIFCENERLKAQNEGLAEVKKFCEANKIELGWRAERQIKNLQSHANGGIPEDTVYQLKAVHRNLGELLNRVNGTTGA